MPDKDKSKTSLRGRDAKSGEFIPVREARQRPNTTTVERVPLPGRGDTGRSSKPTKRGN